MIKTSSIPPVKLNRAAICARFETALSTIELLLEQVTQAGEQQMLFVMLNELKHVHTEGETRLL